MKKLMIMGGMMGFMIGAGFGLAQEVAWPALFLRASVAALVAGLLLRWWGGIWVRSLQECQAQQSVAAAPAHPPVPERRKPA